MGFLVFLAIMIVAIVWGRYLVWSLKTAQTREHKVAVMLALVIWSIVVVATAHFTECETPSSPNIKVEVGIPE